MEYALHGSKEIKGSFTMSRAIRSPKAYIENHFNTHAFFGCFKNYNMTLSDIDYHIERNGHILIVECKQGMRREIPKGQSILRKMAMRSGQFTFMTVWHEDSLVHHRVIGIDIYLPEWMQHQEVVTHDLHPETGIEKLKEIFSAWDNQVDTWKYPDINHIINKRHQEVAQ